jgi:uncharacterized protein YfdQ (DUF2303 family)
MTEAESIAGLALPELRTLNGFPFVITNEKQQARSLEWMLPVPARGRGTTNAYDLASFIALVVARKTTNIDLAPEIFWTADEERAQFCAVLNPEGWADHRIDYRPNYSVDWIAWTNNDGKRKGQADFAQFIEDNAPSMVEPAAADMIEIARSMEAKKKVRFASAIRLSDGQTQFAYEEEMQGTVLKGTMLIPEQFKIGIQVFVGGDRYAVDCRLRYRIEDGRLAMWYEMIRPHLVIEDAVKTICDRIAAGTACPMYRGATPILPA